MAIIERDGTYGFGLMAHVSLVLHLECWRNTRPAPNGKAHFKLDN